jgi:hypothetical protein
MIGRYASLAQYLAKIMPPRPLARVLLILPVRYADSHRKGRGIPGGVPPRSFPVADIEVHVLDASEVGER